MTIDPATFPATQLSSSRPKRLASAADALAATLPVSAVTEFRLTERAFVRTWPGHSIHARRDDVHALWVISCRSTSDGWCSGEQRCCGSFSADQALEWGEQLWHGSAEVPCARGS